MVLRIDGSDMMQRALPGELEPLTDFYFTVSKGDNPHLTGLVVGGQIGREAIGAARNRGRAKERLAPIFEQSFQAGSNDFAVVSEVSQVDADTWLKMLEAQRAALATGFPTPAPVVAPKRTLHVFASPQAYAAYFEGMFAASKLPSGDYCVLLHAGDDAEETNAHNRFACLYWVAFDSLGLVYANAPYWWRWGQSICYAIADAANGEIKTGVLDATMMARVRTYVSSAQSPSLPEMLAGADEPKDPGLQWRAAEAAAAWISFLMFSEAGAHRGLLTQYHEELRAGTSAADAAAKLFPASLINDLHPRFVVFLEKF